MTTRMEATTGVVLLALFLYLGATAAVRQSPTVDEFAHLPAGYAYLTIGDFSLYAKNPPLIKMIAALPLLVYRPMLGDTHPGETSSWRPWMHGTSFMRLNAVRYHRLFVAGRCMILALGAALGLAIWLTARKLYGPGGGIAALSLYAVSPDFLAQSSIVSTDVGATLFMFLAVLGFLFFLDRPGPLRGALCGALFGCALLSKFTSLLLAPVFLVGAVAAGHWHRARRDHVAAVFSWKRVAAGTAALFAVAWSVLLAGYGFPSIGITAEAYHCRSEALAWIQAALPHLPLPVPFAYLVGLDDQLFETRHLGFPNYLLGSWYEGARWEYYPLAVLVKTPLPILLAIAAGIGYSRQGGEYRGRPALSPHEVAILLALAWLALGVTVRNNIQVGVRYLLPSYSLAYVLAGRIGSAEVLRLGGKRWRALLIIGAFFLLVGVVRIHPNYLSYFNILAGGPENGHRVLLDSNLDWGQDLPALARYMREHGDASVTLGYFGSVDPAVYGIAYEPLARAGNPGLTAVSAAYLMGFDYPLTYLSPWQPPPLEAAAQYRDRVPVDRSGYSIFLFRD